MVVPAALIGALCQALVHEYERSGSAWMLEWLILPQMVLATAGALRTSLGLLDEIEVAGLNS